MGIDPGITGGLAYIGQDGTVDVRDMPVFDDGLSDKPRKTKSGRKKSTTSGRQPDPYVIGDLIRLWQPSAIYIEKVRAMPKHGQREGTTSMFNFGTSAGVVFGAAGALGVPVWFVEAPRWKRDQGLIGKTKDASRLLAIKKYPRVASNLKRKKDNGRAEALLIADFGVTKQ